MILARVVVVLAGKNPKMYLYVLALDNFIVGLAFLISLLFRRPLIQLLADSVKTRIPQEIQYSSYYGKAWKIVTFVWAIVYLLFAFALVILKAGNLKVVGLIDMLGHWPLVFCLFIFTLKFPGWYWKRNYAKIKPTA
jgi:uncharacterized membrane protein